MQQGAFLVYNSHLQAFHLFCWGPASGTGWNKTMPLLVATLFCILLTNKVQFCVLFAGCFSNYRSEPELQGFPVALFTTVVLGRFSGSSNSHSQKSHELKESHYPHFKGKTLAQASSPSWEPKLLVKHHHTYWHCVLKAPLPWTFLAGANPCQSSQPRSVLGTNIRWLIIWVC